MGDRIDFFTGNCRFLSNFWPAEVWFGAEVYPTVEHAYQAAKTKDPTQRLTIQKAATPGEAKRLGRRVTLRPDWESVKIDVMRQCLEQKFADPALRAKLVATGDRELIEGNTWGDRFWGQCPVGVGGNMLGRLLMDLRAQLRCAPLGGA